MQPRGRHVTADGELRAHGPGGAATGARRPAGRSRSRVPAPACALARPARHLVQPRGPAAQGRPFDAALASYQQALDRGVSQPEEVHLNRGVIYSDCLRRTRRRWPNCMPRWRSIRGTCPRCSTSPTCRKTWGNGRSAGAVRACPRHRPSMPCRAGALRQPQDGDRPGRAIPWRGCGMPWRARM